MYPLTHVGTFNTRWHLDKKNRGRPDKIRVYAHVPQIRTETEFLPNSVSLIKSY